MKTTRMMAALLAASTLPLAGCMSATYGQKIESGKVAEIVKGKTTKDELLAWFGQPMQSVMMPDGGRTMYWVYSKQTIGSMLKADAQVFTGKGKFGPGTNLSAVVDKDGIVRDYEFASGGK